MRLTDDRLGGAGDTGTVAAPFDLAALYAQHHRLVRWLVQGAGVPGHAIDDVVQDVFVAAHRRQAAAPEGDRRRWLVGVARSICHSYRRSDARRRQRQRHGAQPVDGAVDEASALQRLRAALATVSPAQREAFVLVDLQGLSAQEVATTLGVNLNTVYSRVRLARRRIVADLSDDEAALSAARREGDPSRETQRRTWAAIAAKVAVSKGTLGNLGGALVGAALGVPVLGVIMLVSRPSDPDPPPPPPSVERTATVAASPAAPTERRSRTEATPEAVHAEPVGDSKQAEPVAEPRAPSRKRRAPEQPSQLEQETVLLRRAAKALDEGRREQGCELLARHRERFEHGLLVRERERLQAQPKKACVAR